MKIQNKTMFALEIDFHRGGRCYAMQGGITTTDIKFAFHRSNRSAIEDFSKIYKNQKPRIVEVN